MKNILIVDDEPRIRLLYKRILSDEGYRIFAADNADSANELLKHHPVDLVLLDLRMPSVDGTVLYEVARMFHQTVKIIVSSVYPVHVQRQMITGAIDYYDKSHVTDELTCKIKKALETTDRPAPGFW